jgi:hypothetical protein
MGKGKIWLLCWVPLCCAYADSAALRPSADTCLFSIAPDNNLGANPNAATGGNSDRLPARALFRFDVAGQIPANALIQSAALTLTVVIVPPGAANSIFDLRRVFADWGEGTGTGNSGSPAKTNEATWNHRFYPVTSWTVPGGAVSSDFSSIVSASLLSTTNLGSWTFGSTSNLVSDVQDWVRNPAANFGWVLLSESETTPFTVRLVGTREDTNNAPELVVQYAVPSPPTLQGLRVVSGQVQFSFLAQAGQYLDSMLSGNWLTLTNVSPQAIATNVVIIDFFPANAQRFYRVGAF